MNYARRGARIEDIDFFRTLYCGCVLPVCAVYPDWNYERVRSSFDDYIRLEQMEIITCDDSLPVGWLQIQRKGISLHVVYLFLTQAVRNAGIGSDIVRSAVLEAKKLKLPCTIDVLKNNDKAVALYKRLGFSLLRQDAMKYYLIYSLEVT